MAEEVVAGVALTASEHQPEAEGGHDVQRDDRLVERAHALRYLTKNRPAG